MSTSRGGRGASTTTRLAFFGTATAMLAACGANNVRPALVPLPDAYVDTLRADAGALVATLAELVAAEGFRVRRVSAAEGYLETDWYDTAAGRAGGAYTLAPGGVVRLRFFADPIGQDRAQLAAEAVYRPVLDPSLPAREAEAMVPPGHPGDAILNRVLDAAAARFPRATETPARD